MCTRVLWNSNGLGVMTGRTMDWPTSTEPRLVVFPAGRTRDGGLVGGERISGDGCVWTSRHASLVTTIYGIGTADGINDAGLAAHLLYLQATDFGPPDGRPQVHAGLWAQYALDMAATVPEALEALEAIQVVMVGAHGHEANVHLALEDAGGDSAIIEYIDGAAVVHHGPQHRVMTNDPVYEEQLVLLAAQDFSQPSREMPLPGNVNARDRFQRAAYYLALLPEPSEERGAVAGLLSVMRNVSVPFGAPYGEFGIYNTEYRTVCNNSAGRYFFELTTSPNVLWAGLDGFDLSPGSPVLMLDPDDIALAGDVSDRFAPVESVAF